MKHVCVALLVCVLVVLPQTVTAAIRVDDDDLLLYLPFNGDTQDYSNKENHGEMVGKETYVEGKFGQALEFAEDVEVKAPYIELNDRSFTVSLWVKPALTGNDQQCVFSQMDTNAQNTSLHFRIYTSSQVRMGFYANDLDAPGAVKKDEWVHITFWLDVDGKSRKIFINGEQVAEDAGKAGIAYKGVKGDTMIGSWGTSGQKFNGLIDEV